jgi:hypothetical protein
VPLLFKGGLTIANVALVLLFLALPNRCIAAEFQAGGDE